MSVVVGMCVIVATLIVWWRMPESRTLLQHWRVLLPFVATWLLQVAMIAAGQCTVLLQRQIFDGWGPIAWNGSVLGILLLALAVFEAAWVSPLLLHAARGEQVGGRVVPAMRSAKDHALRMAAMLALGCLPLLTLPLIGALLSGGGPNEASMAVVGMLQLFLSTVWAALTGAFVFEALERGVPFREALRRSYRLAILNLPDLLPLFFVLTILRGVVVVLPGQVSLHLFSLTGYGMGSHWFSEAVEAEPNALGAWLEPMVDGATLLLVVTIKLRIATSFVRQNRSLERAPT